MTKTTRGGMTEARKHAGTGAGQSGSWQRFFPSLMAYAVVVVAAIAVMGSGADYVGPDNDDVMRLVEVRDFLAGQGWFDLKQYRLGLDGGTLMHWSRLVDLPIAGLVRLFQLAGETQERAEALALAVWPLLMAVLFMVAAGLGGRRLGGAATMHIAFGLAALSVFTSLKFHPGAIDHHNIQMVVMMFLAASLVERREGPSHAIAGCLAALAMAIGAETLPLVAVACACVAVQWAVHGTAFSRKAGQFGLSLAISISLFFFATVPPSAYRVVTCDNLSLGFYALAAVGGGGLFLLARFGGHAGVPGRLLLLGLLALVVLGTAMVIAPECLANPLAGLDPMLQELWLSKVSEAQPVLSQIRLAPEAAGGFYAVGLFAIAVCIFRALDFRGEDAARVEQHMLLGALLVAALAVALIQVRGAYFSNALAILPLSLLINDLRRTSHAEPENMNAGFAYIVTVLASVPVVWFFAGIVGARGLEASLSMNALTQAATPMQAENGCRSEADMALLKRLPARTVAAPSDSGAAILRFTHHRVLSAPYHRNQAGMLTELHIGLATPAEAKAFLDGANVAIIAFCPADPQTRDLIRLKPDGLYAHLARGDLPEYLRPVAAAMTGFQLYVVRPR
ncbi:hypothetical protein [Rhizobium sp. SGZ-381]|uniref:hypothetical protein n=1 Tax=Rhizobium sp. SGZ-381 TaxID=3342800 RepID=UPI00367304C1